MPRSRVSAHNYNVASLHSDKVRDQKGRTWAWPWSIRMFGRVLSRLNAFSTSRAFARNNAAASPRVRTVSTANGYDEVCNRVSALHKCYCGHRIFILRSFVPFYNYMCVCVCIFYAIFNLSVWRQWLPLKWWWSLLFYSDQRIWFFGAYQNPPKSNSSSWHSH